MPEGGAQILEVVIVGLLQVLPDGSDDTTLAFTPAQVLTGASHVEEVTCSVLVGLEENAECVVWWYSQCVLDPIQWTIIT